MSKFVVKNGKMFLSGSLFSNSEWDVNTVSVEINASVVSYPVMGEAWLEQTGLVKQGTFSWETAWDNTLGVDIDDTLGETASLFFDSVDGLPFSAMAVVESISISSPVDGYSTATWSGQSDGVVRES